jgi:hypothetical protein
MVKNYSSQQVAKLFVGFALTIWIIVLCLIILNHALSCIDKNGCLRSFCEFRWLQQPYKDLVKANQNNCFYKNLTETFFEDHPQQ